MDLAAYFIFGIWLLLFLTAVFVPQIQKHLPR